MGKYRRKPVEHIVDAEQWYRVVYDKEAGELPGEPPVFHLNVNFYRS